MKNLIEFQLKDQLVSALWFANYVMAALLLNDHIFAISVLQCLVIYRPTYINQYGH